MLSPNVTKSRLSFTILGLCVLVGLLFACNQPFDPRGDLDQKPVVFLVLSTDRDVQFVRVERSYVPIGNDPLEYTTDNFVPNATVTMSDGYLTMRFHDTTFSRFDTSRFKFPLRAYAFRPFIPRYGVQYEITAQSSELGTAGGKVIVPTRPSLALGALASDVLNNPGSHQSGDPIPFEVLLSDIAKGFFGRLFIEYSVYHSGEWIDERAEVPVGYTYSGLKDFKYVTYAQPTRRPTSHQMIQAYNNEMYNSALINLAYTKYLTNKIVFNRVVFQFLQVEQNLYDYYLLAHAFNDPHSMRLDQPDFSNIAGGVGVVGAYTLDSLVHPLPENFIYNRQ